MKLLVHFMACFGLVAALGQESTNTPPAATPTGTDATVLSPSRRVVRSIGPATPAVPPGKVEMGGAIPKLTRSKSPLQMLNPLAPRQYGDGTDVLARDLTTGEAQGVTFLSFTCPERISKAKAKKAVPPAK